MAPLLLVLLIVLPFLELQILWKIGEVLGVFPTLGLLVLSALVGSAIIRRQGLRLAGDLHGRIRAKEHPGENLLRAGITVMAGVFLIVPGVLSDLAGLVILIPPVRNWLAAYVGNNLLRRMRIYPLSGVPGAAFTACGSDQATAFPDAGGGLKEAQARVVEDENEHE